jgi:glycosyltransferase involved in cell wall biosynthesis
VSGTERIALRLGILVPCRDEAAVIERKLANLAQARWPEGGTHRIAAVDDHSVDGTLERAGKTAEQLFGSRTDVLVSVVRNGVRAGKPGAVQTGLALLEPQVDLIVLTDADVVLEPGSLEALSRAFSGDPRLAMACGAQRFVRDLAEDGTPRSASLGPIQDASEPFDRWTARVRRLESWSGRLFSVHGQLLAWRADLRLRPRPGIAADDLDLMLQVRSRASEPRRVALAPGAIFCEVKIPVGPARRAQALRRARAYVQVVRTSAPLSTDAFSRAQWFFYRRVTLAAPVLTAVLPLAATVAAWTFLGLGAALALLMLFALIFTSAPGWRWAKLVLLIRAAKRLEAESALSERWEPERWKIVRR